MKKTAAFLLCALLLLFSVSPAYASQSFYYTMNIPAAVTLKKSAQAQICVSSFGGTALGSAVFAVLYDPNVLEYKETVLNDGIPGEVKASAQSGVVRIVYLNANGTLLPSSGDLALAALRFTALTTECSTTVTLHTQQAVNLEEQRMSVQDPVEYRVTLQAKETNSTAQASGRRVSAASVSSQKDKSASDTKNSAQNAQSQVQRQEPQLLQSGTYSAADTLTISGQGENVFDNSGFIFFLCGAAAAAVVVALVAVAYTAGLRKRRAQQPKTDIPPDSGEDGHKKETNEYNKTENEQSKE